MPLMRAADDLGIVLAPGQRGHGRGDLHVRIDVVTPSRLDARQTELLRELAELRSEEAPTGFEEQARGGIFSRLKDSFGGK